MSEPIQKFRAGQLSCALWENEINVNGQTRTVLKASIARRYKDANGDWKSSTSFSRNEIPLAIYCLEQAFEAIIQHNGEQESQEAPVEEVAIE
jgi:hypothetical protein